MGDKKSLWLIVNPISGIHHGDDIGLIAHNTLNNSLFDISLHYTEHKGHGAELAREAVNAGIDIVAAVGGDGTINEVASQLVGTDTIFAIIPHGSGNGLAYHLQIPINVRKALMTINDLRVEKLDVGYVNGQPFFSIAGIGFDAKVAYDFDVDPRRGFYTYLKHILRNYFNYQPADYHIEYDGQSTDTQAFFITFANSSQWGYNVRIAPNASMHDGILDVCMVKRPRYFLRMLNVDLPKLLTSRFDKSSIVQYLECQNLHITSKNGEPVYLHIDGDTAGVVDHVEIKLKHKALNAIVPKDLE
ncbi:MAG: diacylglycerol kinase family lipid kinase [Bacteroidales bacterium]|nr:diacylglycerol kinase family lipid kinase [Bacteroidales bacterium]